jgi:hypothetical protein
MVIRVKIEPGVIPFSFSFNLIVIEINVLKGLFNILNAKLIFFFSLLLEAVSFF